MRPELAPLPRRMRYLFLDHRGYPVPWFVAWINGAPDFRVMDPVKWGKAVGERRCWVCGQQLGTHLAFVIGPMCGINRTTSEPPCHLDCAKWSAANCPFLSRPQMVRREDSFTASLEQYSAGDPLTRNPGVTLIWITSRYRLFGDPQGKPLIQIGDPSQVLWYCQGRPATRAEVKASIDSGLPTLMSLAVEQDAREPGIGAVAELNSRAQAYLTLYPPEETNEQPKA